jgi:hypothetical protein
VSRQEKTRENVPLPVGSGTQPAVGVGVGIGTGPVVLPVAITIGVPTERTSNDRRIYMAISGNRIENFD